MDHLVLPENISPNLQVPYRSVTPYEPGDFHNFPTRRGWTSEHLYLDDTYGHRSPAEIEEFFQTWLYFGMLREVLHTAGQPVTDEDFVDRGPISLVTTRRLPEMLLQWQRKWPVPEECNCSRAFDPGEPYRELYVNQPPCPHPQCWKKVVSEDDIKGLIGIHEILVIVESLLHRYWGENDITIPGMTVKPPPVAPEIVLSISVLGHTLASAVSNIYRHYYTHRNWTVSALLEDRMRNANWCPSRITQLLSDFEMDGVCYLALQPAHDHEDHSSCNKSRCLARGLDVKTYQTKHVTNGCNCAHVAPPMPEVLRIIDRGGIPIVTWDSTESRLIVSEFRASLTLLPEVEYNTTGRPHVPSHLPDFVAMSHVWAHGLGNLAANSLPACQLSRIQAMVNEIDFRYPAEQGNMPFWMDTLCVPVDKHLKPYRRRCIANMRHTYKYAVSVLVLDSDLEAVPLSRPAPERLMRLSQCSWQQRLWTFQESFLGDDLFYRFQDGPIHYRHLGEEAKQYTAALRAQGRYVDFIQKAQNRTTLGFHIVRGLTDSILAGAKAPGSSWVAYLPLAVGLSSRRTSRASDEILCAATILGLSLQPFLDITVEGLDDDIELDDDVWARLDQELADLRMELFLQHIGRFRGDIIFSRVPRLQREGYRWAPRSLMGSMNVNLTLREFNDENQACLCSTPRSIGLGGRYAGFRLERGPVGMTSFTIVDGENKYRVDLVSEGQGIGGPVQTDERRYYLLLASIPGEDNLDRSHAILGSRSARDDLEVRYDCRATITEDDEDDEDEGEEDDDGVIPAEFLSADTFWIVQ